MSVLPTYLAKVRGRRPKVTPLGLLGVVVGAVVLALLVSALSGNGSLAVFVVVSGAAAIVALSIWGAPARGSYRGDGGWGHGGGQGGGYGAWGGGSGGDAGSGGGDGGGGC